MRIAQVITLDLAELPPQRRAAAGVGRDADAVLEHLAKPLPLALLEEQALERVERAEVVGLHVEHLAVGQRRAHAIAELLLDARDLDPRAHLLGRRVEEAQERPLGLDERHAVARLEVQPAKRLHGAPGQARVGRVEREQLGVGAPRRLLIAQPLVEQHRDALREVDLLGAVEHGVARQGAAPHLHEVARAPEQQAQALDVLAGVAAAHVHRERLAHHVERGRGVLQLLLAQPGDLEQVGDRLVDRADLLGVGPPRVEDADAALVVAVALVDRLEQRARGQLHLGDLEQLFEQAARLRVVGILAEHLAEEVDRPERVAEELHAQRGAADHQAAAQLDQMSCNFGLDRPWAVQYAFYLKNVALHLDFGQSFSYHQPVFAVLQRGMGNTLLLAVEGIYASTQSIADGSYPLFTTLYVVQREDSPNLAAIEGFVRFLGEAPAMDVMRRHQLVPYAEAGDVYSRDGARLAVIDAAIVAVTPADVAAMPRERELTPPLSAPRATLQAGIATAPGSESTQRARAEVDRAEAKKTARDKDAKNSGKSD